MSKEVYFITGIDTDSGKSITTAILAKWLRSQKRSVITQKMIQTGNIKQSDDILTHRQIMEIPLQDADLKGLTAPYIFPFPSSPHLAAKLCNQTIDTNKISKATEALLEEYDIVLLEGAGGLLVPITEETTTADYITEKQYPIILVTSAKLGSINHTLLTLEAIKARNLNLQGVIFNHYPAQNQIITNDSIDIFSKFLSKYNFNCKIYNLPNLLLTEQQTTSSTEYDFQGLFKS